MVRSFFMPKIMKLFEKETKIKRLKEEIIEYKNLIISIGDKIKEKYKSVQDFRVDAITTESAIKSIERMNREKKTATTNLNKKISKLREYEK